MAHKVMIIVLVGPPNSGKTELSKTLMRNFENWIIINQNELRWRNECIKQTILSIKKGFNVLVDRCNITREQREYWVRVAKRLRVPIDCLDIVRNPEEAKKEMQKITREVGELYTGCTNLERLERFTKEYEEPERDEGFNRIITIFKATFIRTLSYKPHIIEIDKSLWDHLGPRLTLKLEPTPITPVSELAPNTNPY